MRYVALALLLAVTLIMSGLYPSLAGTRDKEKCGHQAIPANCDPNGQP
jgi:hypothetical protein